jgi:6-pyruvoyltetrahydropterin/6-carboxytetrahydropterin synthase
MWKLEKTFRFEASHRLPHHDGKCARLHGHSWVGVAILESDALIAGGPKAGMVQDFGDVSRALARLVEDGLDHHHLNDSTGLQNPTSEELARWVFDNLRPALPLLAAVRIEETCTSAAEYRP